MFCPKCGKRIDDTDIFCKFCGTSVSNETARAEDISQQIPEDKKSSEVDSSGVEKSLSPDNMDTSKKAEESHESKKRKKSPIKVALLTLIPLVLLIFVFVITPKKQKIPDGMTQEVYDLGWQAVSLMEKFHSGEISSDDVEAPLRSISKRLDSIYKETKGKITNTSKYGQYGLQNDFYARTISMYVDFFLSDKDMNNSLIRNYGGDTYDRVESIKKLLEKD